MHKDQKLSHYIENTNEIICVYCAFNRYKTSPNLQIKELNEKSNEIIKFLDKLNVENKNTVNKLTNSLNRIKDNFSQEEENITKLYDSFIQALEEKKKDSLVNINNIYQTNLKKIQNKIDEIKERTETCEGVKESLSEYLSGNNKKLDMSKIFNYYMSIQKESQINQNNFVEYKEFKYYFEDSSKTLKLLSNLGELRTKNNQLMLSNNVVTSNVNTENLKRNNYSFEFEEKKRSKKYNNDNYESKELINEDSEKGRFSEKNTKNNLDFRQPTKKDMSFTSKQPTNLPLQQNLTFNYNNSLNTHESNYSNSKMLNLI